MTLQIHGVMKKAQDLDHLSVPDTPDAEQDEVTPFAVLAGDMKREESLGNVVALSCADDRRAGGQVAQCRREGFGVDTRLRFAESRHRPAQDLPEVGLRGRSQADRPTARPCAHFERVAAGFPAIASVAIAVK